MAHNEISWLGIGLVNEQSITTLQYCHQFATNPRQFICTFFASMRASAASINPFHRSRCCHYFAWRTYVGRSTNPRFL